MKEKRKNNSRGITLVALIITIIVMLILVGVSVQVVINSDLIGTAQDATNKFEIAFDEEKNMPDYVGQYVESPVHSGLVHNGAIYKVATYNAETSEYTYTELEAGEKFPETVSNGDIYIYGDYEYRYNKFWNSTLNDWQLNETQAGWGVRVLDNSKQQYGLILENINGKSITKLRETFNNCKSLIKAPAMPATAIWFDYTFSQCENLTDITAIKIPEDAIDVHGMFNGCASLVDISTLVIPGKVTRVDNLFYQCDSLVDASTLVIPNSAIRVEGMFNACPALTTAPAVIPENVERVNSMFYGCISLRGNITINANPTYYTYMFYGIDMRNITLSTENGACTMLDELGATGNNYNS